MGFKQANSDLCIYTASGELFLIAMYVYDIVLAGTSDKRMKEVKDIIAEKFTVKDLGKLHHCIKHSTAVKRIFSYLNGTINFGLLYSKDKECTRYSDANWVGDANDRKSTSGFVFKFCGAAVNWRSKKLSFVTLSTVDSECIAIASAAQ